MRATVSAVAFWPARKAAGSAGTTWLNTKVSVATTNRTRIAQPTRLSRKTVMLRPALFLVQLPQSYVDVFRRIDTVSTDAVRNRHNRRRPCGPDNGMRIHHHLGCLLEHLIALLRIRDRRDFLDERIELRV